MKGFIEYYMVESENVDAEWRSGEIGKLEWVGRKLFIFVKCLVKEGWWWVKRLWKKMWKDRADVVEDRVDGEDEPLFLEEFIFDECIGCDCESESDCDKCDVRTGKMVVE
jgi:hypothetical protein